VRLPVSVYASGQGPAREFDMSNEAERIEVYEMVLTNGTVVGPAPMTPQCPAAHQTGP
jgi:hypothetical protein